MEPARIRPRHEATDHEYLLVHERRWHSSSGSGSHGCWPRPPPTTSTGTRSPSWCTAAARHGSRFISSGEAVPWPATFPSTRFPSTR